MKKSVYLCGPITGLTYEQATEERNRVAEIFEDHDIEAKTPMRGKIYILDDQELKAKGYEEVSRTDKAIVGRDRNDVRTSSVVLADLRGATRVSIGSMVEFGWADAYRVPIVTVMDQEGNPHDHGFVHQLSVYVVHDIHEAIELTLLLVNA